jgi:hypothetical protein
MLAMRANLVKFCDYAGQLTEGGKFFMFGLFDTIGGATFPLTHPLFYICFELEFEPAEAGKSIGVALRLIDEDGKQMIGIDGQFTVPPAIGMKPTVLFQHFRIESMVFPKPGAYRLDIISDGHTIAEARLYLLQGAPPGHNA